MKIGKFRYTLCTKNNLQTSFNETVYVNFVYKDSHGELHTTAPVLIPIIILTDCRQESQESNNYIDLSEIIFEIISFNGYLYSDKGYKPYLNLEFQSDLFYRIICSNKNEENIAEAYCIYKNIHFVVPIGFIGIIPL